MSENMRAPDDIRNALARLVVRCAAESNARLWSSSKHRSPDVRLRGGPKAKGWKGAEKVLGISFQIIKKATEGRGVRSDTVERLRAALIAAGELKPTRLGGTVT